MDLNGGMWRDVSRAEREHRPGMGELFGLRWSVDVTTGLRRER